MIVLNGFPVVPKPMRVALGRCFEILGDLIGSNPYPFLGLPVLVTLCLTIGCLYIRIEDDIRFLYSPEDSPSRKEYQMNQRFTGEGINSTYFALAVEAADDSKNLLTVQRTDIISDINDFVLKNLTFSMQGKLYHFGRDICPLLSFCPDSNRILEKFILVYWNRNLTENPQVTINYPIMKIFENKFFLPGYLYGVKTHQNTGRIAAAAMVHLTYPIPAVNTVVAEEVAEAFQNGLSSYLQVQTKKAGLEISPFSLYMLKQELAKNTYVTLPFISITIVLLVTFTVCSCMTGDMITSKPLEALAGVVSSGLALISAAGLLFMWGVPFITQVTVMPFIALAIGVDDTYIILGAWQNTDRRLKPHKRLALALKEAGSAITVTSLTDCLSFGIGSFSTTPAISIFCKFTALAIFFDYLYQITFFAAVCAIGGRREAQGKHCIFIWNFVDPKTVHKVFSTYNSCPLNAFFRRYYAKLICRPEVRTFVSAMYFVYLGASLYGITTLQCNLTPSNLLVDDSPLRHYIELAENHMWSEGLVGRVYVNKAPNFTNGEHEVTRFLGFVKELEHTNYSIGENSTQLWLRDFLNYWQYFVTDYSEFYKFLHNFVQVSFNSGWKAYLFWNETKTLLPDDSKQVQHFLPKFYFTTGFQISNWRHRTDLLLAWRNVCSHYPDYDAVIYDENNFYSDQVLALPQVTMQTMGIALIFMMFICMVFISEFSISYWVAFSLMSMDVGIIGFLALWGSDLSPTTIVNILMSVGLSVDFATHVGYRFSRVRMHNPDERMEETLGTIAWPVLQGGLSTFLAVFGLQFVQSFVVRVFFKTILLVVSLGLFHGLVFLPVILRSTYNTSTSHIVPDISCEEDKRKITESSTTTLIGHGYSQSCLNGKVSSVTLYQ